MDIFLLVRPGCTQSDPGTFVDTRRCPRFPDVLVTSHVDPADIELSGRGLTNGSPASRSLKAPAYAFKGAKLLSFHGESNAWFLPRYGADHPALRRNVNLGSSEAVANYRGGREGKAVPLSVAFQGTSSQLVNF